jgi:glucosamine--fructose-6-phosphate aminotransferase (isomerizing)
MSDPVRPEEGTPAPADPSLPGQPDPWAATSMPSRRPVPPFHMTEMIEAEPALARRLLGRLALDPAVIRLADAVRHAASSPALLLTGCGTSEHGALAAADIIRAALDREGLASPTVPAVVQALELALDPPTDGLVIGVSHEGGTWATNLALERARDAGARTALISVGDRSPAAALADPGLIVGTRELDQSWCHTVGYLSPILVAAAVGARISGRPIDPATIADLLAAGLDDLEATETMAARVAAATHLVVVASGVDRTAGRELVLKVEEATWMASAFRDLETMLHGHLPATDDATALVLILTDPVHRSERIARARQLLAAAGEIGLGAGAIVAAGVDRELDVGLTPAGRLVVPEPEDLAGPLGAVLGTVVPLQLLTERMARARGTDPDPIRRDDPRYLAAAEAVEG